MSTNIQQARDVLAKWRKGVVYVNSIIPLIEGTAANGALLDAVDSLLSTAQRGDLRALGLGPLLYDAERIAETILAADERMSA